MGLNCCPVRLENEGTPYNLLLLLDISVDLIRRMKAYF